MGDLLSGTGLLSGNLLSNPAGSSVDPTGVDSNVMWMVEDPRMYVDDAETDLLRLSGGAKNLGVIGSGNFLPRKSQSNINETQWSRQKKTNGRGTWRNIRVVHFNGIINKSAAASPQPPFVKYANTVESGGSIFDVTWNGNPIGVNTTFGLLISDPIQGLVVQPDSEFWVNTIMKGLTTSTAQNIRYEGFNNTPARFEGCGTTSGGISSANISSFLKDYGRGWTGRGNIVGGNITSVTQLTPGINYGGGTPNVYAYEVGANGVLYVKNIGYFSGSATIANGGNPTGFAINTTGNGAPPAGHTWVNPKVVCGTNNVSPATAGYAPLCLIGECDETGVESVLLFGDSLIDAYQELGNVNGRQNAYERLIDGRAGTLNLGVQGSGSLDWDTGTQYVYLLNIVDKLKSYLTRAFCSLGSNDIAGGYSDAHTSVLAHNISLKAKMNALGLPVAFSTLIPRLATPTPSTDGIITEANQIFEAGFSPGGTGDQYNEFVRNGTLPTDWGYIDPRLTLQGTNPNCWRCDQGTITGDGIHWSDTATDNGLGAPHGIAFVASDPTLRAFFDVLDHS